MPVKSKNNVKETIEMAKLADHMDRIAEGVTEGYKKIEDGVVNGYRKIEDGVVTGYRKIEEAFVGTFMAKEGESVEDAKARIAADRKAGSNAGKDN